MILKVLLPVKWWAVGDPVSDTESSCRSTSPTEVFWCYFKVGSCSFVPKASISVITINTPRVYYYILDRTFILLFIFRLEFGTAAQPPVTPQSGAEKPVTPTGERREYSHTLSIEIWVFISKIEEANFLHFSNNSSSFSSTLFLAFYSLYGKNCVKSKSLRWFLRSTSCQTIFWNIPRMFPTRHCIKNTKKAISHHDWPVFTHLWPIACGIIEIFYLFVFRAICLGKSILHLFAVTFLWTLDWTITIIKSGKIVNKCTLCLLNAEPHITSQRITFQTSAQWEGVTPPILSLNNAWPSCFAVCFSLKSQLPTVLFGCNLLLKKQLITLQ